MTDYWIPLNKIDLNYFIDTRAELYWASQIVSTVGSSLLLGTFDNNQTHMAWLNNLLVGKEVHRQKFFCAALDIGNLTTLLLDGRKELKVIARHPLKGATLEHSFDWAENEINQLLPESQKVTLRRPNEMLWEVPDHPLMHGAIFHDAHPESYHELAHWYDNAHTLLEYFKKRYYMSSDIVCWGNNLDMLFLNQQTDNQAITFGFSPGDSHIEVPYFFCRPWPAPLKDAKLITPALGKWHSREEWTGLVLTAEEILNKEGSQAQADLVRYFYEEALVKAEIAIGWRIH